MKKIFVAGLVLLPIIAVQAQSIKKPSVKWFQESLELTSDNLGEKFGGHDCNRIVSEIKKAKLEKDEFETTEAFQARVSAAKEKPLYGSVTYGGLFALQKADQTSFLSKYNADHQRLDVKVFYPSYRVLVDRRYVNLDVVEVLSSKTGSFTGANAFGVTKRISSEERNVCGVAFSNLKAPLIESEFTVYEVPAEKAKSSKNNLAVLYIGSLVEPFIVDAGNYKKPTMDSPYELWLKGNAVVLQLVETWLINASTGEVLAKVKN